MAITGITINAAMLATLVRVDGIHMAEIRAVRLTYNLFWGFLKKLGGCIFEQWLVKPLNMF